MEYFKIRIVVCKKLLACAGIFFSAHSVIAEPMVSDDWLASIDDVACWISTHPFKKSLIVGEKEHDPGMYFNIAFQKGSPQPEFSISKIAIEKYNEKVGVKVGAKVFEFIADEDIAFSKILDDRDILFQMLGGDSTSFKLNIDENFKSLEFFISLEGFNYAYNYIAKTCNFAHNSDVYKNMSNVDVQHNAITS